MSARDGDGGSATVTYKVDATPPAIAATTDRSPDVAGWYNAPVTVSFTCDDTGSGVATCPPPVVVSTDGDDQVISRSAVDVAGNSASASQTVSVDTTPPTITATVSPTPTAAGWNNTAVTVTFTCADSGSGVAECPDPVSVSTEGADQDVSGTATDNADNTATATATVSIDTTAPTITAAADRPPDSGGWYNAPVTVTFTCADTGSGVAECPDPVSVSTEGADQDVSGTATDNADNTATATATVSIDTTAPTITAAADRPPDSGGSYTAPVTVTFTCADTGSGIAECPVPVVVSTEGDDQLVTGTAVDLAGNSASASMTVTVDLTASPTITATVTPTPNPAGWNNTAVTVTFTCSGGAGIANCPDPFVVSSNGADQVVTGTVTDNAGNTATVTVTVSIDTTPPTITATLTPVPNPAGWNNTAVTVTFTCADGGSGIASCPDPFVVSSAGADQVVTGTVTDNAGNTATATVTVSIDPTAPTVGPVTAAPSSVVAGQAFTVTAPVADPLSGVTAAEAFIGTDPGQGAGTAITLSGSNATGQLTAPSATGTYSASVRARDTAGNWSNTSTTTFTVTADTPPTVTPTLMVSTSSNRANPVPLHGAPLDGAAFIYLDPGNVTGISRVEFTITLSWWLRVSTVDNKAPYDFLGTDSRGRAYPLFTRLLPPGTYTLTATIRKTNGQKQTVTSTFTIVRP